MGENNYTIVQNSYRSKSLITEFSPKKWWRQKTKGQKTIILSWVGIGAFAFVSLIFFFITEGL